MGELEDKCDDKCIKNNHPKVKQEEGFISSAELNEFTDEYCFGKPTNYEKFSAYLGNNYPKTCKFFEELSLYF